MKRVLTRSRLEHSLRVMQVMDELAGVYGLNATPARMAGLLHDAAKDLPSQEQLALADEAGLEFAQPCERLPIYLHAPVGAYLVAHELDITDSLVLDTIATHSSSAFFERW